MKIEELINNAFQSDSSEEFKDFILSFNTKQIPLIETNISPRVYNYWEKSGLLEKENKRKWKKLSFIDYLWLRTIEELRKFNTSFEVIREIKEKLFEEIDLDKLLGFLSTEESLTEMDSQKKKINDIIESVQQSEMSENDKEKLIHTLKSADSMLEESTKPLTMRVIEVFFLLSIKSTPQEFGLIITEEFPPEFFYGETIKDVSTMESLFQESHLYISITKLYYEFLSDENKQKYVSSFKLESENEKKILSFMKKEKFTEIRIKRNMKETILTGILSAEYDTKSSSELKREMKLKYPFCEIIEKQHEGKTKTIEFVIKEKIK